MAYNSIKYNNNAYIYIFTAAFDQVFSYSKVWIASFKRANNERCPAINIVNCVDQIDVWLNQEFSWLKIAGLDTLMNALIACVSTKSICWWHYFVVYWFWCAANKSSTDFIFEKTKKYQLNFKKKNAFLNILKSRRRRRKTN